MQGIVVFGVSGFAGAFSKIGVGFCGYRPEILCLEVGRWHGLCAGPVTVIED